ncbi:MAG: nucleoside monophosphate kinase [bacterium]
MKIQNKFLLFTLLLLSVSMLPSCFKSSGDQTMTTNLYSFFGAPGCGKGTVAERLISELNFTSLSTGNLFRQHIQDQSEIGKELKKYIDAGKLVPDELVDTMVFQWLKQTIADKKTDIILDGYPRTKAQAEALQNILKEDKAFASVSFKVINFNVPEEEIVQRLSNRLVCENKKCQAIYSLTSKKPAQENVCDKCGSALIKRKDDDEQVVRERLSVFAKFKDDLLGFYRNARTIIVDFEPKGSPDEVFVDFKQTIINK